MIVWVDEWQQACCGDDFAVGSRVTWQLHARADPEWLATVIGQDEAATVTHCEEHHDGGDSAVATTGTVRAIRAAYCRFAPRSSVDAHMLYPVPKSTVLTPIFEVDAEPPQEEGLSLVGFLVDLDADR